MITIVLPWPARMLSPNSRGNWYTKENPRKAAIETGYLAAREAGGSLSPRGRYSLTIEAYPPSARRADFDNVLASLKPAIDGIFRFYEVDDSRIKLATVKMCESMAGGLVRLTIEEMI